MVLLSEHCNVESEKLCKFAKQFFYQSGNFLGFVRAFEDGKITREVEIFLGFCEFIYTSKMSATQKCFEALARPYLDQLKTFHDSLKS